MKYGPPVVKQCEYCHKEFTCPNHLADKQRFCSMRCNNKSRARPRTEYTCVNCGDKFMALPDHGAPRKFCSRKCFSENSIQPIEKECKNCGALFTATRSGGASRGDGRKIYCSRKCYAEGSRHYEEKSCPVCGNIFYPVGKQRAENQVTCSSECRIELFSGANSPGFKGGEYVPQNSNHKMVLVGKIAGYKGKYISEHRLLISKYLGRMLTRNETVIHINNDGLDNRLSNLYLCESISEYARRRNGSLPWPKKSNLDDYKEQK